VEFLDEGRFIQLMSFQVIDGHITPAIFRLVCKHFNDPSDTLSFEEYCQDADKWIDCWVGCAHVLVQLGKRVRFCNCFAQHLTKVPVPELGGLPGTWADVVGKDN